MLFDCRAVMILKYRIFFFTSSIIRYNKDGDLSNVLPNDSESLLDILILDFFVVIIDSGISYKGDILVFLVAIVILRSSFYLILYSRYYFIFSS